MARIALNVEISEALYHRLFRVAAVKGGPFRAKNRETAQEALETFVEIALEKYMDNIEGLGNKETSQE